MSRLADVNYSRNGEQQPNNNEVVGNDAPTTLPLPTENKLPGQQNVQPDQKYVIFKLVNKSRNGGVYIPYIDDAINPATGRMERMRLLTGVDTIWQKDQKDIPKEYVDKNGRNIQFPRGAKFIRIPTWDTTALEFMRRCRHNITNPDRKTGSKCEFFEYDPAKEAKAAEEKEFLALEMAIKAKEMPEEKMRKHASFLGIQFIDAEMGLPKQPSKIRQEYMLYAKRNPEFFKQTMDSREVDIQFAIKNAILDGKIDIGKQPGTAFWSGTMGVIGRIPPNQKPLQYLTELALTNTPEGRAFKEQLQTVST